MRGPAANILHNRDDRESAGIREPRRQEADMADDGFDIDWHTQETLERFLARQPELTQAERAAVIGQSLLLLEQYYVHLPFKREVRDVDPIGALKHLVARLPAIRSDREFHAEMCDIFNRLGDLHTAYHLPGAYADHVAFLPFQLGALGEPGHRRYVVTHVLPSFVHRHLRPGAEVERWNGAPIDRVVVRDAHRNAGANPDAQYARALDMMTVRPLLRAPPPADMTVTVGVRDANGGRHDIEFPWRVCKAQPEPAHLSPERSAARHHLALDAESDMLRRARKHLYAPGSGRPANGAEMIATRHPALFTASILRHGVGYLRIRSFKVQKTATLIDEFLRLLRYLPPTGLILDVRGNGGGLVAAAESLLQLLTPRRIVPQRFQFLATPTVRALCERYAKPGADPDLSSWARGFTPGEAWTAAFPMTDPAACNAIGQRYHGPVVLIVDARCYSACDIFVAGFADHAIGRIIGTSGRTGAGGANVWTQQNLQELSGPDAGFAALPQGGALRVAVRRSLRVGPREGVILEERGVTPDEEYRLTSADLLHADRDLLAHAARVLSQRPWYRLEARRRGTVLNVDSENIERLAVAIGGKPVHAAPVDGKATRLELRAQGVVDIAGYAGNSLVAARRLPARS